MPTISSFFGITVRMYFDDHGPPQFHAYYRDQAAIVAIDPPQLLSGSLPRRALAMVLEWAALHREALADNWPLAEHHEALRPIEPLE